MLFIVSHGVMTPGQCRAAGGWLDWSQEDLAAAARVSISTVRDFEKGRRVPIANNLKAMQAALESQGIGFSAVEAVPKSISYQRPD